MITGGAGHVEAIHLLNNMISLVMVALNNSLEKNCNANWAMLQFP